jgi:RimJ/RimL family protein N-acetyltransferase
MASAIDNGDSAPRAAPTELQSWLRAGDWPRLHAHFARQEPRSADEFAARALLLARAERSPQRDARLLADWRRAAELAPGQPLHQVNLAQALIDCAQPGAALEVAERVCAQAPQLLPAVEKRVLALHAGGRWADARSALAVLEQRAARERITLPGTLRFLGAELASAWWEPIRAGGTQLRLPRPADRAFIASTLADAAFMRRYHRFEPTDGAAADAYIARAQRPPLQTRRREWIVQDRDGRPAGLAAIVDLDAGHRRGELLLGLPGNPAPAIALQAALAAMVFGFERLGLHKLVSHVYGDNPAAQANTLHLGFRAEGLLIEHLALGDQRLDLHVNGLLAREFAADARLQRLRRRWIDNPGSTP